MTQYRVTYYTHPGSTLTRQYVMAHSLGQAQNNAIYFYGRHRKHGPVEIWWRDGLGQWSAIATDHDIERLI